jgi:hypothetical protein
MNYWMVSVSTGVFLLCLQAPLSADAVFKIVVLRFLGSGMIMVARIDTTMVL